VRSFFTVDAGLDAGWNACRCQAGAAAFDASGAAALNPGALRAPENALAGPS